MDTRTETLTINLVSKICIVQKIELSDLGDKETLKEELSRVLNLAAAKGWIKEKSK